MSILKTRPNTKPVVDLSGPQGNAFNLLALACTTGREFGWSKLAIDGVCDEMKMSNYKHLIETFDKHFGEVIDLNLAGMEL
jgi:hypothetical protein